MKEETQQSQKNTGNHGGGVFTSGRNRASEPTKATKHPMRRKKTEPNRAKKLAKLGSGKIITKTAKNSSFTP